ncbi:universal stress protein [Streptomyces sp. NPDC093111]|uniref:universal stress protein n=1 Tax=Streptomyces sp. NPDC093111 TaxID=3154978 RepID=UPI00342E4AB8
MDGTTGRPGLGTVVVGVDGSPSAQAAATWAADEAVLRGGVLCLVHATDTDTAPPTLSPAELDRYRRAGRELLDRTAAELVGRHPGLTVVTELSGGAPTAGLREAAALSGTIVVGHRGRGGFSSLLLGSVGLAATAGATTPVVVVRGDLEPAETGSVLAAVRDENDVGCARAAAHEALLRKVPLRLLHVWGSVPYPGARAVLRGGPEGTAREHVRALSQVTDRMRAEFPDLRLDAEGQKSHSVPGALVEASRHVDLLVVGGRRAPGYLGPTLGRTTLSLLQHAHCPVELIPRHGPGHGSTS